MEQNNPIHLAGIFFQQCDLLSFDLGLHADPVAPSSCAASSSRDGSRRTTRRCTSSVVSSQVRGRFPFALLQL